MISAPPSSSSSSHKVHWTLVLALGWLIAQSNQLANPIVPAWAAFTLILGTLALILMAGAAVRLVAKRLRLHPSTWVIGPTGLFLPRETQSLPRLERAWLAAIAPAVYLAAGLSTLPFLTQAGGLEGLVAAWDWWSWPMIAARFSFIALALAAIQALPVYPLSGAYLLEAIVGRRRFACCLSLTLAFVAGVVFWHVPLVAPFAVYFVFDAASELRRINSSEPSASLTPHPLPS